jgi:hypothetical protein
MLVLGLILHVGKLLEEAEQVKLWMPIAVHLNVFDEYTNEQHGSITPLEHVVLVLADIAEIAQVNLLTLTLLKRLLLLNLRRLEQVLYDEQDGRDGLITEDLNERREQVDALVLDTTHFVHRLALIVQE